MSTAASRSRASKNGLWRACDRAGVKRCAPYSFRHTAARWMRKSGVPPWEVAAQLGHSVGKEYAVTERYAFYSLDHLSGAVGALDGLIRLVVVGPVSGKSGGKVQESRSSSGVEQRIRNAWVGGSNPSCGTSKINHLAQNLMLQVAKFRCNKTKFFLFDFKCPRLVEFTFCNKDATTRRHGCAQQPDRPAAD